MSDEEKPKKRQRAKKKVTKKLKKKPFIPKLKLSGIREYARKAVFELCRNRPGAPTSGHEKHQVAVKQVAQFLDDQIVPGDGPVGSIVEALDGPLASLLVGAIVKDAYDDLFRKHP